MTKAQHPAAALTGRMNRPVLLLIGILVVAAGLLLPQLVSEKAVAAPPAADTSTNGTLAYQPPTFPDGPDARSLLLRLGVGTVVVLVLCAVVLRLARRWVGVIPGQQGPESAFCLLETFPLGNRCFLQIVKVGTRQVLVARDATGLKSVLSLSEQFESALSEIQNGETEATGTDLLDTEALVRNGALGNGTGRTPSATTQV